jgi:hypothetical protein
VFKRIDETFADVASEPLALVDPPAADGEGTWEYTNETVFELVDIEELASPEESEYEDEEDD